VWLWPLCRQTIGLFAEADAISDLDGDQGRLNCTGWLERAALTHSMVLDGEWHTFSKGWFHCHVMQWGLPCVLLALTGSPLPAGVWTMQRFKMLHSRVVGSLQWGNVATLPQLTPQWWSMSLLDSTPEGF